MEESGSVTHSKMDIDPILSNLVSTGDGSSGDDGSVFSLERLFEEAGVNSTDDGAELALLRGVWKIRILQINFQHSKAASPRTTLSLSRNRG